MACKGCRQEHKEKSIYESVKKMAKIYAKESNEIVFIYRTVDGYNFAPLSEVNAWHPVEYISPLQ